MEWLERRGACGYEELAQNLGVSCMTIRRDIDRLSTEGVAIKVPGGAQRANAAPDMYESELQARMSSHRDQKRAIARQAIEWIEPGQTIFLDGGTTCIEMAKRLSDHVRELTVVTNSFPVCRTLGQNRDNTILFIGGEYDPASLSCVGVPAEDRARGFFLDKAFFSTKGFVPAEGMYESSVGLFKVKQIIAQQSEQVILLADQSKFGQRALCKALDVSSLDVVITDRPPDESAAASLAQANVHVLVAPQAGAPNQERLPHAP